MKAFYILALAAVLSACSEQKPAASTTEENKYYFADKYKFASRQQADYFERAARFRVLQQGLGGDFDRFLKGEMPSGNSLAKYRENITQAVGYYGENPDTDDPFQSCGAAAKNAETLVKIMVASGGGGVTDSDRDSYQSYRQSMQACRKAISEAENSLPRK